MKSAESPQQWLDGADVIHGEDAVRQAVARLVGEITVALAGKEPLVLCVMGGGVVFAGWLLPQLDFPLQFDYVQASRYHAGTAGSDLVWKVAPGPAVRGRSVLLLDDILDEGITLAAVRDKCLELGAADVKIAVLAEKMLGHPKPVAADFVGLTVPDRYVFGCGMDVYGWWRNLPRICALRAG